MKRIHVLRSSAAVVVWLSIAAVAHAQPSTPRAERKAFPAPQGFSVVLVLGDTQSVSTAENVPAAARKALADMKDFLPYRGYRLLDASWVLGSSRATTRLRGTVDGKDQEYLLTLRGDPAPGDKLRVIFQLQEPGMALTEASADSEARRQQIAELQARLRSDEAELAGIRQRSERPTSTQALTERITETRRALGALENTVAIIGRSRSVIDTTFNMDVGETVVVGTSRLRGGDKALIALLTAVPRGK